MSLHDQRKNYNARSLRRSEITENPFVLLNQWLHDAMSAGTVEANAMVLATATNEGLPSSRTILLKQLDHGLVFFTNYNSRKGRQIKDNPHASLTFFWRELERQVNIEGSVERTSPELSDHYFASRPRGSQLSAWTSHQSETVESREVLEKAYKEVEKQYEGRDVPTPPHWGGFRLIPVRLEFWQGRPDRLHDRFEYRKKGEAWEINRLAP